LILSSIGDDEHQLQQKGKVMPIPSLSFSDKPSKPRELCPEGTFQAELVRAYYVGTQENKFNPAAPQPKIIFVFELDEPMLESDGNHILSTTVTYSLNEKSGLTKLLKPVMGSSYPDKPGQQLDIDALVGLKVMVTVSHTHKDDKTYANIAGLARLPRGMQPFSATLDAFSWSCDDINDPNGGKVPQWVKDFADKRIELGGESSQPKPALQVTNIPTQPSKPKQTTQPLPMPSVENDVDDYPF
jgi:hypothetical protein